MSSFREIKDRAFMVLIIALTLLTILPLFHIIITVTVKGLPVVLERGLTFVTGTLEEGGIGPAIVGTILLVLLASLIGIPIAYLTGVYAYENPESILGRATRVLLQVMLEFPTILVGVFVMGLIVVRMGSFSLLAGALALAIIMIPYVAVYTHEALRGVPFTYKEAAYSLGLSRSQVVFRVLTPMAKRGILTGFLIGMAKVAGETAPLLFTIGGAYQVYFQGITKPVGAIPLLIYTFIQSPSEEYHAIAWGASFILLLMFLVIFIPIRMKLREVKM
ncbi:phosphate ABC transporter permease PstA [Pyrococcus kukulkanii]|uniref:phosphate ABC transporter permease PstA n=1 Tax=Pyrococcus kukulkanii TaxID=1609559 RepID=UPI003564A4E9